MPVSFALISTILFDKNQVAFHTLFVSYLEVKINHCKLMADHNLSVQCA
jgi:hypothetical protein